MQSHGVEIAFAAVLAGVALALATAFDLPLSAPTLDGAAFLGVHYVVPLGAAMVWGGCMLRRDVAALVPLIVSAVCYVVVVWLHFNIKTWVPLVNPRDWDGLFRRSDEVIRPLVDAAFALRLLLARHLPMVDSLYVHAYIAMFYTSFALHALRSPDHFRKVFLAALFFQGLGALSYLAFPCVGPFIFEPGVNPAASQAQAAMLTMREELLAGGADWLSRQGGAKLFGGLAAMPSLHAGAAFLFLWFAARWERLLFALYLPLFLFILVEAVATRWHYVIDLPIGVALAAVSIAMAFHLDRPRALGAASMRGRLESSGARAVAVSNQAG